MNGPEHYAEAEYLLQQAAAIQVSTSSSTPTYNDDVRELHAAALVHATLAVAAGQVTHIPLDGEDPANFDTVVAEVGWEQALGFEVMRRDGGVTR